MRRILCIALMLTLAACSDGSKSSPSDNGIAAGDLSADNSVANDDESTDGVDAPDPAPTAVSDDAASDSDAPGDDGVASDDEMVGSGDAELADGGDAGPSFSCTGKLSAIERRICGDGHLAILDRDLADSYRVTRGKLDTAGRQRLTTGQRQFLARRNRCTTNRCIADAYTARLTELNRAPSGGRAADRADRQADADQGDPRQIFMNEDRDCGGPPQAERELYFQCTRVGGSPAACDAAKSCEALRRIIRRACAAKPADQRCSPNF